MADPRRNRRRPTSELFIQLLGKLTRIDDRLAHIEAQQTLAESALTRHGRFIEDLNRRCLERLGIACPIDSDAEGDDG